MGWSTDTLNMAESHRDLVDRGNLVQLQPTLTAKTRNKPMSNRFSTMYLYIMLCYCISRSILQVASGVLENKLHVSVKATNTQYMYMYI